MARGGVDFKDALAKVFTFKLAIGTVVADEGKAVAVTDKQTAGLGTTGDRLLGKLIKVEGDGYGSVEVSGVLYVPYLTGTVPTVGSAVVVDGAGNVKNDPGQTVNEGGAATVIVVSKGRGIVIDVDTINLIAVVAL